MQSQRLLHARAGVGPAWSGGDFLDLRQAAFALLPAVFPDPALRCAIRQRFAVPAAAVFVGAGDNCFWAWRRQVAEHVFSLGLQRRNGNKPALQFCWPVWPGSINQRFLIDAAK